MADVREMETESTMVCFHPLLLTVEYLSPHHLAPHQPATRRRRISAGVLVVVSLTGNWLWLIEKIEKTASTSSHTSTSFLLDAIKPHHWGPTKYPVLRHNQSDINYFGHESFSNQLNNLICWSEILFLKIFQLLTTPDYGPYPPLSLGDVIRAISPLPHTPDNNWPQTVELCKYSSLGSNIF